MAISAAVMIMVPLIGSAMAVERRRILPGPVSVAERMRPSAMPPACPSVCSAQGSVVGQSTI